MSRLDRVAKPVVTLSLAMAVFTAVVADAAPTPLTTRALSLFRNRQYEDAIRLLLTDVEGKSETQTSTQDLLLGECYYTLKKFGEARPHYVRAVRNLPPGKNRSIAEQRLVKVLYSLKDYDGALERIDSFIDRNGDDRAVGSMLVYRMMILSRADSPDTPEIEQLHKQVRDGLAKFGSSVGMEADRVLSSHYQQTNELEKARGIYQRIVYTYRDTIAKTEKAGQTAPESMKETHDNAALQLGVIEMSAKRPAEAIKWLENVRYHQASLQRARLMLAKLHYDRRDFPRAIQTLTTKDFITTVDDPLIRSDMYLVLGLAEYSRPDGDFQQVERALSRVDEGSRNYIQAQRILGDARRERGLNATALKAYQALFESPDDTPHALYSIGMIYLEQADGTDDTERKQELLKQASTIFHRLFTDFPLAPEVKEAKPYVDDLQSRGFDVSFALSGDEKLDLWKKIAAQKPGTAEGAQALISLIREYAKQVNDEKSGKVVKAPNYVACAGFCDRLLDAAVFQGQGFDPANWKATQAETAYHRAHCELRSLDVPSDEDVATARLSNATAERAAEFFQQAQGLVDPKELALVKQIRLGLVEAMFRSDDEESRKAAEAEFKRLEADYGNDARFQKLALELADWYRDHSDLPRAARLYAGVADRGQDFTDEQRMQLYFAAGSLFGQAARESLKDPANVTYAVVIQPKQVIDLSANRLLATWHPLRRTVEVELPNNGKKVRAEDALREISKKSGIPFVWIADNHRQGIARFLRDRRLDLPPRTYTVKAALERILDLKKHRLVFDIGLTGSKPTVAPAEPTDDNPRAISQVVEIYTVDQAEERRRRFAPLNKNYGSFEAAFGRGSYEVTLYRILERLEKVTGAQIQWAEGLDREDRLAAQFKGFPGINTRQDRRSCDVLTAVLKDASLEYDITQRPEAAELFEAGLAQYSRIRQINPRSEYAEKSLFQLALDCYSQKEYGRMKIVLREYLKLFDGPEFPNYRSACFWVGWAFENDRNYGDACQYYQRAAEERLVLYSRSESSAASDVEVPQENEAALEPKDELFQRLSHELQFALLPVVQGNFRETTLRQFADFLRFNTHVEMALAPSAQGLDVQLDTGNFENIPAWDLLYRVLDEHGLGLRIENADLAMAEKAYYRMAASFQKDNLMQQALENCETLLERYPETSRRPDAYRLMIDIYRGLKDYGRALAMLEQFREVAGDSVEKFQLDAEIARLYFDMANYQKARTFFRLALEGADNPADRLVIREGYARAMLRLGEEPESLAQYQTLAREQIDPLREFAARQMVWLLKFRLHQVKEIEYPQADMQFIQQYENLSDEERGRLSTAQFAKATWIYYVLAQVDIEKKRRADAKRKLAAVSTSPDESLAGQAGYELGRLHMDDGDTDAARAAFEHLLFTNPSSESVVRGTYSLAQCWLRLQKPQLAGNRFAQLIERYPASSLVQRIERNENYRKLADEARARGEAASTRTSGTEAE